MNPGSLSTLCFKGKLIYMDLLFDLLQICAVSYSRTVCKISFSIRDVRWILIRFCLLDPTTPLELEISGPQSLVKLFV